MGHIFLRYLDTLSDEEMKDMSRNAIGAPHYPQHRAGEDPDLPVKFFSLSLYLYNLPKSTFFVNFYIFFFIYHRFSLTF